MLPVIEEALGDRRTEVRGAAARALRLAEAPQVDQRIASTITGDPDPQVRAAAIFAASFRRMDAVVDALLQAASTDQMDYVRNNAIALLRQHPDASPAITETLARIAEHDPKRRH